MATVTLHLMMSLDGFGSKLDESDYAWMLRYTGDDMAERIMNEVGAVVLGNAGFRDGLMTEETLPYGGHPVPQFVVTHHAREPVELGGLTFTFVTGGVERAIERARQAAGEKRVALVGVNVGRQAVQAGLVDELVLHVAPVLLGDGLRVFHQLDHEVELRREEVMATGDVTSLRFSVAPKA